jgi:hypothetical protein
MRGNGDGSIRIVRSTVSPRRETGPDAAVDDGEPGTADEWVARGTNETAGPTAGRGEGRRRSPQGWRWSP